MLTVLRPSYNVALLLLSLLVSVASTQFFSVRSLGNRIPGVCPPGCYDCGFGTKCVPIKAFHDGKPDCPDGSDEWCLPGYFRCGAFCVELKYVASCLFNPRCDGRPSQPGFCTLTKNKLCLEENSFPCKAYGECVLWSWVRDGKPDCLDGSDERDLEYISIIERGWKAYMDKKAQFLEKESQNAYHIPNATSSLLPMGPRPLGPTYPAQPIGTPYQPFPPHPTLIPPTDQYTSPRNPFMPPSVDKEHPSGPYPSGFYSTSPLPSVGTNDTGKGLVQITVHPHDKGDDTVHIVVNPGGGDEKYSNFGAAGTSAGGGYSTVEAGQGQGYGTQYGYSTPQPAPGGYGTNYGYSIPPPGPGYGTNYGYSTPSPGTQSTLLTPDREDYSGQTGTFGLAESSYERPKSPFETVVPIVPLPHVPVRPSQQPWGSRQPWGQLPVLPFPTRPPIPHGLQTPSGFILPVPGGTGEPVRFITPIPGGGFPGQPQTRPPFPDYGSQEQSTEPRIQPTLPATPPPDGLVHPSLIPFDATSTSATTVTEHPEVFFSQRPMVPIIPVIPPIVHVGGSETGGESGVTSKPGTVGVTTIHPDHTSKATLASRTRKPSTKLITTTLPTTPESEQPGVVGTHGVEGAESGAETTTTSGEGVQTTTGTKEGTVTGATEMKNCEEGLKDEAERKVGNPYCDCSSGQIRDSPGQECKDAELSSFNVNISQVCEDRENSAFSNKDLARITMMKMSSALRIPICARDVSKGTVTVSTACNGCSLDQLAQQIRVFDKFGIQGDSSNTSKELRKINVDMKALDTSICDDSSLYNCHRNAECIPHQLTFRCKCKKGTNDTSLGRGVICEGIPEEDDCIFLFGVCLVFWALLLLGALFLIPLLCYCCWKLFGKKKRRVAPNVAFNTKPTVIDIDKWDSTNTQRILQQAFGPRAQGVLATGRALQNLQLKSILKPQDTVVQPLEVASIEQDAQEPIVAPSSAQTPVGGILSRASTAKETPIMEKGSPTTEDIRTPAMVALPKRAELAKSATPPSARSATSRTGSMHHHIVTSAGTSKGQPQTAPASPVISIKVPVGSKTAPSTPQIKSEPPNFSASMPVRMPIDLHRADVTSSPAPSTSSRISRPGAPTIWETYRVLGDQYAKPESARPDTSDSLEKLIHERYPTPPQKEEKEYDENPPPMDNKIALPAEALVTEDELTIEPITTTPQPVKQPLEHSSSDVSAKLANMLGVSLESPTTSKPRSQWESAESVRPEDTVEKKKKTEKEEEAEIDEILKVDESVQTLPHNTLDEADQAALVELAVRGLEIDVPPDFSLLEELRKLKPKTAEERKASASSSTDSKPASESGTRKGPTFTRKKAGKREKEKKESKLPIKKDLFVPRGTRRKVEKPKSPSRIPKPASGSLQSERVEYESSSSLRPPRGDAYMSTEEDSELENAIFRFEQAVRKKAELSGDSTYATELDVPRSRRHKRRRRPERQLSSISEKSAEIAEEVLLPADYIMSAPTTTRDPSAFRHHISSRKERDADWSPSRTRASMKETSDVDLPQEVGSKKKSAHGRYPHSDVDIPKEHEADLDTSEIKMTSRPTTMTRLKRKPITGSTQSIGRSKSSEKLSKSKESVATGSKTPRISTLKSSSRESDNFFPSTSEMEERLQGKSPGKEEDRERTRGTTFGRRRTIHRRSDTQTTIGKRIAARRHPHAHIQSARGDDTRGKHAKSCGDLCEWCNQDSDSSAFYMPGIKSRHEPGFFSARHSPSRARQLHRSLTSLRGSHGSQMDLSPYFDPIRDSSKPHKEGLWWGHEHA